MKNISSNYIGVKYFGITHLIKEISKNNKTFLSYVTISKNKVNNGIRCYEVENSSNILDCDETLFLVNPITQYEFINAKLNTNKLLNLCSKLETIELECQIKIKEEDNIASIKHKIEPLIGRYVIIKHNVGSYFLLKLYDIVNLELKAINNSIISIVNNNEAKGISCYASEILNLDEYNIIGYVTNEHLLKYIINELSNVVNQY